MKTFLNVKMIYPNKYFERLTNTIIFENVNNEKHVSAEEREREIVPKEMLDDLLLSCEENLCSKMFACLPA